MDPLTQGLLGAATAQLGFRQRIGRDASWMAAIAAFSPDLDSLATPLMRVLGMDVNMMTNIIMHRNLTHSLFAVPVIAFLWTWIWWWLRRRYNNRRPNEHSPPSFRLLYACTFVAVLSHPLLDLLTSYGTQLFAPFSNARLAIDAIGIIDIFYTPILALTLLACWIVRKAKKDSRKATLIIGWVGFILSCGYIATGRLMHSRSIDIAHNRAGQVEVIRSYASPYPGTILLWRTVIETPDKWIVSKVHPLWNSPEKTAKQTIAPKNSNQWINAAKETPEFEVYNWFAMGYVRDSYSQLDGMHIVEFHDLRYSRVPNSVESIWPLQVVFDSQGQLQSVQRLHPIRHRRRSRMISQMWREIWSKD